MHPVIRPSARGFTITELLVTTTIALLLIAAITTYYVSMIRTSGDVVGAAKLNLYLRSAVDLMATDIRRAGYWNGKGEEKVYRDENGFLENPFMDDNNDIQIAEYTGEAEGSCITFTYDANQNGTLETSGSALERFGFRLGDHNKAAGVKSLKMRRSGTDNPFTCNNGSWWDMLDHDIHVSTIRFELDLLPDLLSANPYGSLSTNGFVTRQVHITLTGHLTSDPATSHTITEIVRIRNDKYGPSP